MKFVSVTLKKKWSFRIFTTDDSLNISVKLYRIVNVIVIITRDYLQIIFLYNEDKRNQEVCTSEGI